MNRESLVEKSHASLISDSGDATVSNPQRDGDLQESFPVEKKAEEIAQEEHEPNAEIETLLNAFSVLAAECRDSNDSIRKIEEEISRLKTDDAILTALHQTNRELSEEFYEREIIVPLLHSLIGITDRIYQQIQEQKRLRIFYRKCRKLFKVEAAAHIIEQREADLVEIESTLENYGVERFLTIDEVFDPRFHKAVQRIESQKMELKGIIERRVLPGYKRNGKVIRQERVTVYVEAKPRNGDERNTK